jgi:hypothetical protein
MALNNQDAQVLQEIVDTSGKCMDSNRCKICPFRVMCLPEFLNPKPPTTSQREKMAIDVLTHHALIDEEISIEEHQWNKK